MDEPPPSLRFQRYQFSHRAGRWRKRSYRSALRVEKPKTEQDCHRLLPELARRMYRPNGSVDLEDLMQIGELKLAEGLNRLKRRAIHPGPAALKSLMESAQSAMFHAIDQQVVGLESGGDTEDYITETLPGASCNVTVIRRGSGWDLAPGVTASWGSPLPPGSCQPRPTPLCGSPGHLPLSSAVNDGSRRLRRPAVMKDADCHPQSCWGWPSGIQPYWSQPSSSGPMKPK
ncbi:MAG: hypothetical protein IH602_21775 [Bryobacteraceae bacterium]|nr:hypothetical protein [Bryobacteraceae bacterium]